MRSSLTRFTFAFLFVVLSTGAFAAPALAMDRDNPRDPDDPIVRVVKLVKHFVLRIFDTEQIGIPKP
jgi:hypothetical protein